MKKRMLSMLLALIIVLGLIPVNAFAAGKTVSEYFDGLPVTANPGTGTTAWKVGTKDGQEVLLSGSTGKDYSTSTLTLTFTEDSHMTFEYKVSSEAKYDKCTIKLGSTTLVNGESGEQDWKGLEVDAKKNDKLTMEYTKDGSGNKNDDCVYLRNFTAGEALVVTFHANNGTEDTATQKIFGGKGTLKANTFTCAGKIFAGWATASDGAVQYEDGAAITLDKDLDLYAVWADAYTVTLKNGEDVYATVLVPQNTAIGSRLPADPTKKGYTFSGWFSGDTQLTAETVITGDVTYEAQWSPITYTIALKPGEGQGQMDPISATYDQEITLPKNTFTRPGYYFNGWSTYASSSSGSYADEATVKNLTAKQGDTVTLYAAWYGLPVKVTLHLNYEGAEDITRTGIVGSNYNYIIREDGTTKFDSIQDPTRTGYIFDGWFDAAEGGNEIALSYKFTAEDAENGFHMYAHWTKGITVHFDGNGYKNTLADKTVTPDQVYSSLPYLSKSYYPANKALDGWYVKNADGSFGEAVTKDTVFTGDEVTLIAKWRDYQYVIKYNVKYSDKSTTTGTMADQTAPFGQDVTLTPCGYSREGYVFAGWAESSYGTEVKYLDGAVINRPFEEGDYWDDGSEDGETYNLYAIWTENKSPEQKEAEEKLAAAEKAISGTYNPKYGTDTNALTMIRAKLTAAGITDVTVTMKEAAYSTWNYVGIAADGTIQYKWNEKGTTPAASGTVRPTLVLTYKDTYTKDSDECLFNIPLDEAKAMAALNTVAGRITPPETVESASDLTSLPKYPLKAGVDESTVDYNDGGSQELWTTASWTSSNQAILSITESNSAIFAPYKATVTMPKNDTTVTVTLKLVYNGREDLTVTKVYTILFKGTDSPRQMDYQALLETTLRETGLTNPRDGTAINTGNVTSDIQFPTTSDFRTYAARDYHQDFDGKYTPILLCTSDENVVVSADPTLANVARMLTYQPLPGQGAKTVTVTVKILDRPSGSGKDYGSMPVLASKDIVLTVQPMQQSDLDAAFAFMKKVCTEDVYWEGIRNANTDRGNVTGDMQSFIEIVPDGDGYRFIRNMNDYNMCGVKADDIPGWYAAQKYRCFRSSNDAVVAHETLLVTQPQYNTRVTVDSVLTYTEYAKYYEKFRNDPAYAEFAKFYQQPISTTVTVTGRDGEDPDLLPFNVTLNLEGSSMESTFQDLTGASYRCAKTDNRTAADVLFALLSQNKYDYQGSGYYVTGITDPNGVTLSSGDKRFGSWSGWMFTVNGEMPILRYDENGDPIYATLDSYYVKKDDVIRLYYVACPTADGHHTWDDGKVTKAASCTEDGEMTYTCTMCGDQKTEIIPATGHAWGQPVWTWTGVESATATFTCANDAAHVEVENAVITNEITTPATCTADGVRTYTAAVTFQEKTYTATKTEAIPATGHDTELVGAKAATCTEDGYTGDEVCKTCQTVVKKGETIPATGHDTELVNAKAATCTEDGYTGDEVCKICQAVVKKGETIPATGHDTELVNAKAATCTEDGYTGDQVCKTCGETVKKGETIPATGHDTELVGAKAATCTEDGYTGDEVCKTCGETVKKGETIPATGHDFKDGKCTVCGAEDPNYQPEQPEKPEQPENPGVKTGDSAQITLWSGVLVMAAMAGYVLLRKRKAD